MVGRRGGDQAWLTVAVAVTASAILDVPEGKQRVLAGGLLRARQLCADAGPDLAATSREAAAAMELVPGAVSWIERHAMPDRITAKTFAKRCAPTMIRCAVDGVVASGAPDCDDRLRTLLEAGIAACPVPQRTVPSASETPTLASMRAWSGGLGARSPLPDTLTES